MVDHQEVLLLVVFHDSNRKKALGEGGGAWAGQDAGAAAALAAAQAKERELQARVEEREDELERQRAAADERGGLEAEESLREKSLLGFHWATVPGRYRQLLASGEACSDSAC